MMADDITGTYVTTLIPVDAFNGVRPGVACGELGTAGNRRHERD